MNMRTVYGILLFKFFMFHTIFTHDRKPDGFATLELNTSVENSVCWYYVYNVYVPHEQYRVCVRC